jgi:acyl-[acyl-carrier protein] desaturase
LFPQILYTMTDEILSQREVLRGMQHAVAANLSLLLPIDKAWQPTDFLPDLSTADWRERLGEFRAPAQQLSDEVLIVLVGNMVTEEALPNYAVSLNIIAEDFTGASEVPWAQWLRGWTAEENRHGDLLNAFLRLTGRVDMRSIELTIHHLINRGFEARTYPDLYGGMAYTAFQERATRISHQNAAEMAEKQGNEAMGKICRRIAGDEARHETFYTRIVRNVIDQDPEGGVIAFGNLLRRIIAMPGRLMFDGKDPDLFDHFAAVAQRLGLYTVQDYASIVRHLSDSWSIATRSLSGKAARAQDFICKHAERVEQQIEKASAYLADTPKVQFSWIHDREV